MKKKYVNLMFMFALIVCLVVTIGLLASHINLGFDIEINKNIIRLVLSIVALALLIAIVIGYIKGRFLNLQLILEAIVMVTLIINFTMVLLYTIDCYYVYFDELMLSWSDILQNNQLSTFLLSLLFETIFLGVSIILNIVLVIFALKEKNFPHINFAQLRQTRKEKRRKRLQDKIDKLEE